MFFWKRWLRRPLFRKTATRPGGDMTAAPPVCRRPDQAGKCHKLDYILTAFGLPGHDPQQSMSERCTLCAAIGSAEPWDSWEHWDQYEQWTR